MAEPESRSVPEHLFRVRDLHVHYGHAHALQGVNLDIDRGVLAVVGRNGMGKTTLCNAVIGLIPASRGSVVFAGAELLGLEPNQIVARGVGYVPQGRRVWPSLNVDEHLRLGTRDKTGSWTLERIYESFPRLAERKGHGGAQLSGGEQQMLAISRALLGNPRLLVMDEPTEGLAPVIVAQLSAMLKKLAEEGEIAVLLIEQNLGVATEVANRVALMVNGRIAQVLTAAELAQDLSLQQRLLGVRALEDEEPEEGPARDQAAESPPTVLRVRRASEPAQGPRPQPTDTVFSAQSPPTRWNRNNVASPAAARSGAAPEEPPVPRQGNDPPTDTIRRSPSVPLARLVGRVAYVVGTFDTKGRELNFLRLCLQRLGVRTVTVDLSTSRRPSTADVGPAEVARHHPKGREGVFTDDRGSAVSAMAEAFERYVASLVDLGGIVSAGGSGGTALVTPAMRRLPVGVPKVMVSTVASGNVKAYVGPSDICMMYSVTDVSGINRISEQVLANAAHALAGMLMHRREPSSDAKPTVGLTMFGVTTPCVQAVTRMLEDRFDCLVFHATGTGGQSMEKLGDSGLLSGVIDVTTTEICDLHMGGVFSAGEERLDAIIRTGIPYVGSCGALDMVNWGPKETVPERFKGRNLYVHNPQVTLMRTTPEENAEMGRWIAAKLNRMQGPVRFLIPEGGVSMLDEPGKPFWDPEADAALFRALEENLRPTPERRLVRVPHNVNEPPFAKALVEHFLELVH